jgi:ketosteroid isomerase-like protein
MKRIAFLLLSLSAACTAPGRSTNAAPAPTPAAVALVLDDWHDAASKGDGERYFGHMTADAVFMGTDASERWTVEEFEAYAAPHFADGSGWTYLPGDRHVLFAADGGTAWFDERLQNAGYGELRGTGVLRAEGGEWKLVHYSMTFTIPNDAARDVVARIKSGAPVAE